MKSEVNCKYATYFQDRTEKLIEKHVASKFRIEL